MLSRSEVILYRLTRNIFDDNPVVRARVGKPLLHQISHIERIPGVRSPDQYLAKRDAVPVKIGVIAARRIPEILISSLVPGSLSWIPRSEYLVEVCI